MSRIVLRGDIFWANLDPTIGIEIKKTRPVVVVSNNVINQRSQLVIVLPLTTNIAHLSPSHVLIPRGEGGLSQDSKVLTEQIRAMDKERLTGKVGALSELFLRLIEQAIRNSLDM
ncbi:MAG TPA: type II toxin-antitoxin system PemK/MazF family toxin [Anaerolineales bacterium]|nr:type II toxin-antitoxin system PemK/MazF family toxin [Anaerolineales bacterium]